MRVKDLAEKMLSLMGYPNYTHSLFNRFAAETALDIDSTADVSRGCTLRGKITLAENARLDIGCVLSGDITVGTRSNMQPKCEVIGDVTIGNYCAIARNTVFQQTNHETTKPAMQMRFYTDVLGDSLEHTTNGPIVIGNDVWIGTQSIILSGVTVGDGAIIGAGSIVTRDVAPYSVVAGVPAEHVKWRFPEEIREALLELSWWDWDEDQIRAHKEFFTNKIESVTDIPNKATQ